MNIAKLLREGLHENVLVKTIFKWIKFYEVDDNMSPREINSGECMNFAYVVEKDMAEAGIKVEELSDAFFYDPHGEEEIMWDPREYNSLPPDNFDEIGLPSHYWIYYNGKHYDAEKPYCC